MLNFDLQKRITELEDHNQKLLAENKRLREMLGISEETISPKQETEFYPYQPLLAKQ